MRGPKTDAKTTGVLLEDTHQDDPQFTKTAVLVCSQQQLALQVASLGLASICQAKPQVSSRQAKVLALIGYPTVDDKNPA